MFVVVGHGSYLLPQKLEAISDFFIFDGISIFFVLSGFLIGGILIKLIHKNGLSFSILKNFWLRRWFRTLPNYFLILITLCILHLLFDDGFTLRSIYRYFIFSQNLFTEHPTLFFPEAWSLSIEEWFYLILPISICLVFSVGRSLKRSIIYVSILVIVLITSLRYYRFLNVPINDINDWDLILRKQVVTRLDSLMFGVIGAYLNYFYKNLWIKFRLQLFLIGVVLFIIYKFILSSLPIHGIYFCVFSFTLISIATLFLLPYLNELKTGKGFLYKPITYISLISYSMYLLNLSIVEIWILGNIPWKNFTDNPDIIAISKYACYWVLVIGLSILIYKYFEKPMTSIRERYRI